MVPLPPFRGVQSGQRLPTMNPPFGTIAEDAVEVPECAAPAWRRIAPPVAFVPSWVDLKEVYCGAPGTSWTACRLSGLRAVHLISPLGFFSVLQVPASCRR